jgi:hypothetical protein
LKAFVRRAPRQAKLPDNKRFAFSIFDDTDFGSKERIGPIYRLLRDLGFRTTKSVWPLKGTPGIPNGGATLQDKDYLEYILELQREGFEIGLHSVRDGDSPTETNAAGFEEFRRLLGTYPTIHAGHKNNRENIYWGSARINNGLLRFAYNAATRFKQTGYSGHIPKSSFFWGDLCRKHLKYVRNFTYSEINLDLINPTMPYRDPLKPFVNFWFSSTDGADVDRFCRAICETNQDRLEAEGGTCIMYTHFAKGFVQDGVLHPGFERLMRRLARKNGWFVPVGVLLDQRVIERTSSIIPTRELQFMELRWLLSRFRYGSA